MEAFNSALEALTRAVAAGRSGQQPQPGNALELDEGSFDRQFAGNQARPYDPSTDVGLGGVMLGTAGRMAQDTLGLKSNPLDDAKGNRLNAPAGDAFHNTVTNLAAMPGHILESLKRGNDYMMGRYPSQLALDAQYGDSAPTAYRPFDDVLNVATALPAAGAPAALMREGSSAGIFGGKLAKTADHNALAKAQEMTAQGMPREQVWNDTGWFHGVDKQWRFEIDDSGAAIRGFEPQTTPLPNGKPFEVEKTGNAITKQGKLPTLLEHPAIYNAYPSLADINGTFEHSSGSAGGAFAQVKPWLSRLFGPVEIIKAKAPLIGENKAVYRNLREGSLRETALHETQHAIQDREGFAPGTSLDAAGSMDNYTRTAGEVESRAVEKRKNLTADERRARPPWLDYDVPEADQIVRFGSNGPQAWKSFKRGDGGFYSNPDDLPTAGLFGAMNTAKADGTQLFSNPTAAAPLAAANDYLDFDAQLAALSKLVRQNR